MFGRKNNDEYQRGWADGHEVGFQSGYVAGRLVNQQDEQPTIRTITGEQLHGFQAGNDVSERSADPGDDSAETTDHA